MTAFGAETIGAALAAKGVALPVVFFETVGSTNDEAKRASREGTRTEALFVANAQSNGRGRSANAWHSPPDENLYFSLLVRPKVMPHSASCLTLVVGIALVEALSPLLPDGDELRIKWPNDLFLANRKLAGVLTESQLRGGEVSSVVVGVGVNVLGRTFPPGIEATSLALAGAASLDRAAILADLTGGILSALSAFQVGGLESFLPRLRRRDALLGSAIRVGDVRGTARGIDDTGRLLVETGGECVPVSSGHVVREA